MSELLSGTELCLYRGERRLFENLNFALNAGGLLLVRGANGSGKTSLLRAIGGLIKLDRGYFSWRGMRTDREPQRFRAEVVWMAHRVGFKGDLSLLENLRFESGLRSVRTLDLEPALDRLGLRPVSELPLRALSAGQQRRVALARVMLAEAPLWLLDEPFSNLDAGGQSLVTELIAEHLADGGACVMAAHQDVDMAVPVQRIDLQ